MPHIADKRCVLQQSVERDTERKLEGGKRSGRGMIERWIKREDAKMEKERYTHTQVSHC